MPTILVADDNSNIQKMVSLVFKEKGIRVVAVGNGEAACRKVPEVHPDVVLADVFMPVRNGYEVCEFVKQDPQFAETPVILLVGAFDPLDEKEAQRVGANGVLKKPFVPPEPLVALVNSLLKIESPIEQAPQAVEAEPVSPPAPVISARSAPEAHPAALSNESEETGEIPPTFGEPVAIPAARSNAAEETEDDADPASEWTRRRAAMDYEIDPSESANMVDKLAAGTAVDEPKILASNKHLPFGGANLPEMAIETKPQSPHTSWPDLIVPEVAPTQPAETSVQETFTEERSPAPSVKWETAAPQAELESGSDREFSAPLPGIDEAHSQAAETTATIEELNLESPEPAGGVWSSSQAVQEAETVFAVPKAFAPTELDGSQATSHAEQVPPVWQESIKQIVEPPLALPITGQREIEEADSAVAPFHPVEPQANQTVQEASGDQVTVDDVVAKVIEKLEPHLHQALANGVLRPLVEEVLNQQRRDKK